MTSLRLPRYLNEPERFLLWTLDEVVMFLIPLLLGLFLEKSGLGLIGGLVVFFLYGRLKEKTDHFFHVRGWVYWQWPYRLAVSPQWPPAWIREVIG